MPHFLLRTRLSAATWARLLDNPEDRFEKARAGADDFGGEQIGYWYSTGRYDCYSLLRTPDVVTAGSLQASLAASGGFADFHPTALLTVDEMKEALRRAETWPSFTGYRPPGRGGEEDAG